MANVTINGLTELTSPAASDLVPVWNVSGAVTRKVTKANFVGATITGGGTIATAGFTLTVPATMTAAGRNTTNTFTLAQTMEPSGTTTIPLTINSPASASVASLLVQQNGTNVAHIAPPSFSVAFLGYSFDNGALTGPTVQLGYNNNGSTPASGRIIIANRAGSNYRLWVDSSGNLRIWNGGDPTNANDASGTVVGAQTSALAAKDITGEVVSPGEALRHLGQAAHEALRRFRYKGGSYNNQEFEGVVVDYAPRYGMDLGRSLNLPTLFSDLIQAVTHLSERVAELEKDK